MTTNQPKRRFCKGCGTELRSSRKLRAYDPETGDPVYVWQFLPCPRRPSWWKRALFIEAYVHWPDNSLEY